MTYTLTTTVGLPWAEALERTRDALSAQGFGILTEINVRSTFEAKLGVEAADAVGDYVILGACNPALASRALPPNRKSAHSCPATSSCAAAETRKRPLSKPSTPRPWSSSAMPHRSKKWPTTPAPASGRPSPTLAKPSGKKLFLSLA